MKVRIKFAKYGAMKYIGHLDMMRYFQKAIRRAKIPIAYSEGYSPHQIMSFAAPLSVGLSSEGEYFDIELAEAMEPEQLVFQLNQQMAEGVTILQAAYLDDITKNAMASVEAASYLITFDNGSESDSSFYSEFVDYFKQDSIPVVKETKRGTREINLKESVYQIDSLICSLNKEDLVERRRVKVMLNASSGGNIKPSFLLQTYFTYLNQPFDPYSFSIHRLDTFTEQNGEYIPLIWAK